MSEGSTRSPSQPTPEKALPKAPTGITGLDQITGGGLPRGRPTLVCGSAGSGKTLLGIEFLVRGAMQFNEPGVFISFEERAEDLAANVASLGFDLPNLIAEKRLAVDHVVIEREQIEETGEYDLEGLFIRLGFAIDSVGAKRIVLDTMEMLFAGLANEAILRAELVRLFRFLKERGVTAVITGERGDGALTRHGLEEYVSDCVILLDHRVNEQVSTRRLRIVKYRGTAHGTNEYPFLIDEYGFSVMPLSSLGLKHACLDERFSTGIPRLDAMLGGKGFFRGSSILVSGTPGTGKTSISTHIVDAACKRGERCLYFAFEEAAEQIMRNMRSQGIDLAPHVESGLLKFSASRPTFLGLEQHLLQMQRMIEQFKPTIVVVDPISNLDGAGTSSDASALLLRLVDFLKTHGITSLFTNLTTMGSLLESTAVEVSSLMDTWILLRDIELNGERNRGLYVLKSRGMAHSNQVREFVLTDHGIELIDVYTGPGGVLTGSSRLAQEERDAVAAAQLAAAIERKQRQLDRKRKEVEARIATIRAEFEAAEDEFARVITDAQRREKQGLLSRRAQLTSRKGSNGQTSGEGMGAEVSKRSPRA